jgi:hypothetical protein
MHANGLKPDKPIIMSTDTKILQYAEMLSKLWSNPTHGMV